MSEWMDAEARVERAQEFYQKGQWSEAAAELRAAVEANPYHPAWHFNLGLTLEAMEDYTHACDAYQTARQLAPDDVEILNCLGVNLTRLGQYAEALECFERIQTLRPDYEPCYCNRIVTYTEFGQHDDAELMFYLARQVKEECPQCYFNIGNSFYARHRYEQAIDCWRQALRLEETYPQAHARIGDTYWSLGDLEQAREHYEAEVLLAGEDSDALLDLGEVLMELGRFDEAETNVLRVLKAHPDFAAGHYCLGELAEKRGDPAAAERCYRRTLHLDKHYPHAHSRLARLLLRKGDRTLAAKHLLAELKCCGSDPARLQDVGELLIEAQQNRRAHKVFHRLVTLRPEDAHARHNLAVSCFLLDDLKEGIRHCRRALKIKPNYPLALYNLALAHLQKGQTDRARRYVARAMSLAPDNEKIRRLGQRLGIRGFWSKLRIRLVPKRNRRHKPAK